MDEQHESKPTAVAVAYPFTGDYPPADHPSKRFHILHMAMNSSLLAFNFNTMWAGALNLRHDYDIPYFAMRHDDIVPDENWLDVLVDELARLDADIVSTVIPFKDFTGLTSTAVSTPDPYNSRRLTMKEIFALPETFCSDDVGGELLVNSGLWVCNFKRPWVEDHTWRIMDRIRQIGGMFKAEVLSEDWAFSKYLHAAGAKIYATRKVGAEHIGRRRYSNKQPFGTQRTDENFQRGQDNLPDGWFSHADIAAYRRLIEQVPDGGTMVELGCWKGRSLCSVADILKRKRITVRVVDTFNGPPVPQGEDVRAQFEASMRNAGLSPVILQMSTQDAAKNSTLPPVDLVFIDANHEYAAVKADIRAWLPFVKPGGIIAGHDYISDSGVALAVDETFGDGGSVDTNLWYKRIPGV